MRMEKNTGKVFLSLDGLSAFEAGKYSQCG